MSSEQANDFMVLYKTAHHLVIQTHAGDKLSDDGSTSFGKFNLGLHVGDEPEKVLANRKKLLSDINNHVQTMGSGNSVTVIHWLNQVHGNHVVNIDDKPLRLTPYDADAIISNQSQTALAIMTADCVPIAIVNEHAGQMANIHAGWQGLANGVILKACEALATVQNCTAVIGACISQASYEVSLEVTDKVMAGCEQMGLDVDKLRQTAVAMHVDETKTWLDLPAIAKAQLDYFGINVMNSGQCSYQNHSHQNHSYYSHRRMTHLEQKSTGRMALVVVRF